MRPKAVVRRGLEEAFHDWLGRAEKAATCMQIGGQSCILHDAELFRIL